MQLVILLTDALVGSRPVKLSSVSMCKTLIGGSQHGTGDGEEEREEARELVVRCLSKAVLVAWSKSRLDRGSQTSA